MLAGTTVKGTLLESVRSVGVDSASHYVGGPIGKGFGLVLPLFLLVAWAQLLWRRADRQGRCFGLSCVPLVGVGSVT